MVNTSESRNAKIRFLAHQRFPRQVDLRGNKSRRRRSSRLVSLKEIEADGYVAALGKLSDIELDDQYNKAVEKLLTEASGPEAARSFNQPYARADVSRWAKMAYWTPDEAAALSLGRDPKFADWKSIETIVHVSPFAHKFAAQREIVLRAKVMGQLLDSMVPTDFLAWAERTQFRIPVDLIEAVRALGPPMIDWKKLFEQSQAKVEALSARIEELEREMSLAVSKPVDPRERNSLLTLVIAMAVKGYTYDPSAKRSDVISEIAGDVHLVGLSISKDTIRKHLDQGEKLLPVDETE